MCPSLRGHNTEGIRYVTLRNNYKQFWFFAYTHTRRGENTTFLFLRFEVAVGVKIRFAENLNLKIGVGKNLGCRSWRSLVWQVSKIVVATSVLNGG
jgi:hypothetical protein